VSKLTTQDEYIHPVGTEPDWREAFYFDFFDPSSRFSGFGYAGVHPNQQIGDVIFAFWQKDILLAKFTRWDFNIPSDIGEERLGFGPLFFQPLEPFRTWEISYDDGWCRLRLTFEAIHPAYSWGESHAALEKTNSHHYEQQGRYRGEVRLVNEKHALQGVGARDHAWGWGARAGIRRWVWASAQFSDRFAFNTFQVTLADGRDILYGYIYRGEKNALLRASRLRANYEAAGKPPTGFSLELESRAESDLSASARVLNAFNISHQERNKQGYHYFCATQYECEGQVGYGQSNFHWCAEADRPQAWSVEPEE
jgi:hypothetical protein